MRVPLMVRLHFSHGDAPGDRHFIHRVDAREAEVARAIARLSVGGATDALLRLFYGYKRPRDQLVRAAVA